MKFIAKAFFQAQAAGSRSLPNQWSATPRRYGYEDDEDESASVSHVDSAGVLRRRAAANSAAMPSRSAGFAEIPFSLVQEIPDHETRTPSDQYPPPFDDQEYADRLTRCRQAMSDMGVDLLWTGWPDAMLYLHGYEFTWYSYNRNPRTGTAVHVDHDKLIFLNGEDVVFSAAKDRRRARGQGADGIAKAITAVLKDEGWLKSGTVVGHGIPSGICRRRRSAASSRRLSSTRGRRSWTPRM